MSKRMFIKKQEILNEQLPINPNLLGFTGFNNQPEKAVVGNTSNTIFTAPNDSNHNWWYIRFPLFFSFKKGQKLTISMIGKLTGPQSSDGKYRATIFNENGSICYDDDSNPTLASSNIRAARIMTANADSNGLPYLFIYCGIPGKCGGNTLQVLNIKVELGSQATTYLPNYYDEKIQSLQSEIDALKNSK